MVRPKSIPVLAALLLLAGCVPGSDGGGSTAAVRALHAQERFFAVRVEAWSEGTERQARLIVDHVEPGQSLPLRSIVRWADDGSFSVLSEKGVESRQGTAAYAGAWGDFLEQLLSRRPGVPVPIADPEKDPVVGNVIVYLVKNGRWTRFCGLRSREQIIRLSDPANAALYREFPETMAGAVDSVAEAVEKLVEALDAW